MLADSIDTNQRLYPCPIPLERPFSIGRLILAGGSALFVTTVLAAGSLLTGVDSIQAKWNIATNHTNTLESIDREDEVIQKKDQRYITQSYGLTLQGYKCNPSVEPDFPNVDQWAKENEPNPVYSGDGFHVGQVEADGTYSHFGYCHRR